MIKTIELGGKERPIHFGVNALSLYSDVEKMPIHDMIYSLEKLTFKQMVVLIWAALKTGAIHEKQEANFDVNDVGDWLDEDFEKFTECAEIMKQTLPVAKKNKK